MSERSNGFGKIVQHQCKAFLNGQGGETDKEKLCTKDRKNQAQRTEVFSTYILWFCCACTWSICATSGSNGVYCLLVTVK